MGHLDKVTGLSLAVVLLVLTACGGGGGDSSSNGGYTLEEANQILSTAHEPVVVVLALDKAVIASSDSVTVSWASSGEAAASGARVYAVAPAGNGGDKYYLAGNGSWGSADSFVQAAAGSREISLPQPYTGQWLIGADIQLSDGSIKYGLPRLLEVAAGAFVRLMPNRRWAMPDDLVNISATFYAPAPTATGDLVVEITDPGGDKVFVPGSLTTFTTAYTGPLTAQTVAVTSRYLDMDGAYTVRATLLNQQGVTLAFHEQSLQVCTAGTSVTGQLQDAGGTPIDMTDGLGSVLLNGVDQTYSTPILADGTYSITLDPGLYFAHASAIDAAGIIYSAQADVPVIADCASGAVTADLMVEARQQIAQADREWLSGVMLAFRNADFSLVAEAFAENASDGLPKPRVLVLLNEAWTPPERKALARVLGQQFVNALVGSNDDIAWQSDSGTQAMTDGFAQAVYNDPDAELSDAYMEFFDAATGDSGALPPPQFETTLNPVWLQSDERFRVGISTFKLGDANVIDIQDPFDCSYANNFESCRPVLISRSQALSSVLFDLIRARQERPLDPQVTLELSAEKVRAGDEFTATVTVKEVNGETVPDGTVNIVHWARNYLYTIIFNGAPLPAYKCDAAEHGLCSETDRGVTDANGQFSSDFIVNELTPAKKFMYPRVEAWFEKVFYRRQLGYDGNPSSLQVLPVEQQYSEPSGVAGYEITPQANQSVELNSAKTSIAPGEPEQITVKVTGADGNPVEGATVELKVNGPGSAATGVAAPVSPSAASAASISAAALADTALSQTTIITGPNGTGTVEFTANDTGGLATVEGTWEDNSGAETVFNEGSIGFLIGGALMVQVTAEPRIINAGGESQIRTKLIRSIGTVENALISISLDGEGSLSEASGTTDAEGIFLTTFTAPENLAGDTTITVDAQVISETYTGATEISFAPDTTVIDGNVIVNSQEQVDALAGITTINGTLTIDGGDLLVFELDPLASLASVKGLTIRRTLLIDLDGLESLTVIDGSLAIERNTLLMSLSGLRNLTEVSSVDIRSNKALLTTNDMANLQSVGVRAADSSCSYGDLAVAGLSSSVPYTNIAVQFPALETVCGNLILDSAVAQVSLPVLTEAGYLDIVATDNPGKSGTKPAEIVLPALTRLSRGLRITAGGCSSVGCVPETTGIETISLPELTSVGGSLSLRGGWETGSCGNSSCVILETSAATGPLRTINLPKLTTWQAPGSSGSAAWLQFIGFYGPITINLNSLTGPTDRLRIVANKDVDLNLPNGMSVGGSIEIYNNSEYKYNGAAIVGDQAWHDLIDSGVINHSGTRFIVGNQ